ncbi:MAG: 30S ribosomal protein S16, partial [Balneolaceae bacterium]
AEAKTEAPPAEEKEEEEESDAADQADVKADEEEKDETESAALDQKSTDMNANEAIDLIKDTPLEKLKGFVPDDEERVTVLRAWESKQSE